MDATPRLALPFLSPGQAQKEMVHNEALQRLDALVAPSIEEPPRTDPPKDPFLGSCFIIGDGATGEWLRHDGELACRTPGGWRFLEAPEGTAVFVRSLGLYAVRSGHQWEVGISRCSSLVIHGRQVLGAQCGPIASPKGGKMVDAEARSAIRALLDVLKAHGLIET